MSGKTKENGQKNASLGRVRDWYEMLLWARGVSRR